MRLRVIVGCALALLPAALVARAEQGAAEIEPLPGALDAGIDAGPPPAGYAADPAALVTRHQWVVDLRYRAGSVAFGGARRVQLPQATPTSRRMGRFAVELYVGKEMIDRVRFDFPLLGADESGGVARRWDSPPSFERRLSTQTAVMIPHSDRATRAMLVDRATGQVWPLPWPFVERPFSGRDGG